MGIYLPAKLRWGLVKRVILLISVLALILDLTRTVPWGKVKFVFSHAPVKIFSYFSHNIWGGQP